MQKLIVLFFCVQFSCISTAIAQIGSVKASDACPGSNKNTRTSKEYAALSQRSAADNTSSFSKPRYQSIYAKKPVASLETRREKPAAAEAKAVPAKGAKREVPVAEKKTAEIEAEDEFVLPVAEEKAPAAKTETTSKPFDILPTEKALTPAKSANTETDSAKGTTATSKKAAVATSKQKSSKPADAPKTKAAKEKERIKPCVKKVRLGKRNATDCPEF